MSGQVEVTLGEGGKLICTKLSRRQHREGGRGGRGGGGEEPRAARGDNFTTAQQEIDTALQVHRWKETQRSTVGHHETMRRSQGEEG